MAWTTPTTRSTGELITASIWNTDLTNNVKEVWWEVAYVQFTADVTISGTSGAQTDVVSSGAITYAARPTLIEFYCGQVATAPLIGEVIVAELWDDATDLGILGTVQSTANAVTIAPMYIARRLTPTAASHTYKVKAWRSGVNGTMHAGSGGAVTDLPGFIRVTQKGS